MDKDIKDCYCVVQIDGKYKGSSNWACVGYGYPTKSQIPAKYKGKAKYKISKIGEVAK